MPGPAHRLGTSTILHHMRRNTILAIMLLLAAIAIAGTLAVADLYNLR